MSTGPPGAGEPWLRAPAKLNLSLRVRGRRPDGYHEIDSLFVPLALCDELQLTLRPGAPGDVRLDLCGEAGGLPADERNLAARAARAFLAEARLRTGAWLRLRKRIPVGAGLGGGSSDAGCVLRALAQRFPGALPRASLERLALCLGADVPFFLDPQPARVRGVGEQIEPLGSLPPLSLLLATPAPPLETGRVYQAFDALGGALTPAGEDLTMALPSSLRGGGGLHVDVWKRLVRNDLERAACELRPEIARLRRRLEEAGALVAGMSGSGPTVFGVFGSLAEAEAARRRTSWDAHVAVHVTSSAPGGISFARAGST